MEADDCNFPGLGASASEGAEMLLGLGAVVLEGGRGAGGCQAVMMSRARSNCRCVRMRTRSATRALRLIQGHRTLAVRCPERSHSRNSVWSRTIRAAEP